MHKREDIEMDYNKTDYEIHQAHEVANKFDKIFSAPFQDYFDSNMSLFLFHHITINIVKFDDLMHQRHSKDYKDGVSLQLLIANKYGYKGWRLIRDLLF